MELEAAELSRERATSSEPCSTRPNPFEGDEFSSRKRQRVSSNASRSKSVDVGMSATSPISQGSPKSESTIANDRAENIPPHTPPHVRSDIPTEPTSSKVTINLRHRAVADPVSAERRSPESPTKMTSAGQDMIKQSTEESSFVANSTETPLQTPSSSPTGSPQIEVITVEDDDAEFEDRSPPVAIIDDDELVMESDPMQNFPYASMNESLATTVQKITTFFEFESVENDEAFCKLRDWIDSYLEYSIGRATSWKENYLEYRNFWDIFPDILAGLSRRRNFFGTFLMRSATGRRSLSDFFVQFARLVARFVHMDIRTLSQYEAQNDPESEPILASRSYLAAFTWLLRKEEQPNIGRNLEAHYRWNWNDDINHMMSSFLGGGGSIKHLTKMVQHFSALIPRFPKLVDSLTDPCRIVDRAVTEAVVAIADPAGLQRADIIRAHDLLTVSYAFFKVMDSALAPIIEKHVTFLNPEAALSILVGLTHILYCCAAHEPYPAQGVLEQCRREQPNLPLMHAPTSISTDWKFKILRKLIVSGQMQLRVLGVTQMCQDLLAVYNRHKKEDNMRHPLLLHFADFILQNKLVDYVVGTGSHPEIIGESGNIIGFLIATKTYTNDQTDMIWRIISTSQDPRLVDAILRMLSSILSLHDYEALLYICVKAKEQGLDSFTPAMREFCDKLIALFVSKAVGERRSYLDSPPYELCIRLIRQSSISRPEAPLGYPELQQFASVKLQDLLGHGPEASVRNNIYVSCIEDISARSPTATGSICALVALLRQNMTTDLHILTENHGLTRLVIDELDYTSRAEREAALSSAVNSPARQARRDLLLSIILLEAKTITPDLGERLWYLLVGRDARCPADRETAWQLLNNAAKKAPTNVFIMSCFKEYLRKLEPSYYTIGCLDFAREAIFAWLHDANADLLDEEEAVESYGVEQLWRIILTALPNSIEGPAVNMLVDLYVESPVIVSMSRERAHRVHLALVNRCLAQLSSAASKLKTFSEETSSGEDESMVIVASEVHVQDQELIFTRSLILLREFLRVFQSKAVFVSPKPRSPTLNVSVDVQGELLVVQYQIFDGEHIGEKQTVETGKLNTLASFFALVRQFTGFEVFKLYHFGREVDPYEMDLNVPLEEINFGHGLVLIRNSKDGDLGMRTGSRASSLELEIVKHFDELWDYLEMDQRMAQEIYYFLVKFPVHQRLVAEIDSETASCAEIFPSGQPFKCLYAVYALREHLAAQGQEGPLKSTLLLRSLRLIISAIQSPQVLECCASEDLRSVLAQHLIECLTQLLKEPVQDDSLDTILDAALLDRMLHILHGARITFSPQNSVQLITTVFEAIVEASLHSLSFWNAFKTHSGTAPLIQDLLLNDERVTVRKSTLKQISQRSTYLPSLARISSIEFANYFWPLLADMISIAVTKRENCEETLALALSIFRRVADVDPSSVNLLLRLQAWGTFLQDHDSIEEIGRPDKVDMVARGLANLVFWCVSFVKSTEQSLSGSSALAGALFSKHLFPEFLNDHEESLAVERPVIMNAATRKMVSDIIVFLTRDDEVEYQKVVAQLSGVVIYDHNDLERPYMYDLPFNFDRSKAIRSSTGYVGLRNLSNTCYLNSLFTQLFMNISFRGFMLNIYIADAGAAQKLLSETQKLFGFMQNSLKRYVDPSELAGSIRTYDDTQIDVSVQMDVDEFYNLLFDRWESQILAPADKKKFRAFYGGQLVQQVKSKECTHISERLEPFSAIQCDIKGKTSLQESLQAYVDGEVMEGDNKYKCSSCDRHVNAVKRACLKDIPDSLIFHLKRFDFNLRTMQRSKINDYFSFPHKIDMRPYTIEHLMAPNDDSPEDTFELVGVLVHSGTAESGHYYSYIRERPSSSNSWVEFNDDNVTAFDPSCIEANCFGGMDYRGPESGTFQFDKSWSAYMLFYQRSTTLSSQQQELLNTRSVSPLRLTIPSHLSATIGLENEVLTRKYCLYDENHPAFVLRMFENIKHFQGNQCATEHALEKAVMTMTLLHLDQVVSRTKDLPDLANFTICLNQKFNACAECCRDFLEWLIDHPEAFRQLLLKHPDFTVRSEVAAFVLATLRSVKQELAWAYGIQDIESDDDVGEEQVDNPRLLHQTVGVLRRFWETFHLSARAWPEYFGLLASVARLGIYEAALLLDACFLRRALDVVRADASLPTSPQYTRMLQILQKRPVTKPVSFANVMELLQALLSVCDLNIETVSSDERRFELVFEGEKVPLTNFEHHLLTQVWNRGQINIFVEKLLRHNQNERATQNILVILLGGQQITHESIANAIRGGIKKTTTAFPVLPFLRAALTFCTYADSFVDVSNMFLHVVGVTRGLDSGEGMEFLQFFKLLPELSRKREEEDFSGFHTLVLEQIPVWAPTLLMYYDPLVRSATEEYLQQIITKNCAEPPDDVLDAEQPLADLGARVARELGVACLKHLHDEHVRPHINAVKAQLGGIQATILICRPFYQEDGEDELDITFSQLYQTVIPQLKRLTVEEPDEEISEWDASDDAFSSSEVMESITDLNASRDIQDLTTQL